MSMEKICATFVVYRPPIHKVECLSLKSDVFPMYLMKFQPCHTIAFSLNDEKNINESRTQT